MTKKFKELPVGTAFIYAEAMRNALEGRADWAVVLVKMNDRVARRLCDDGTIQKEPGHYTESDPDEEVVEAALIQAPPQEEYSLRDVREGGRRVSILLQDPQS